MSKWLRFCRGGLVMVVACSLAMLAFEGREARAGIVVELSLDGGATFNDLAAFTTPLATDPGQLNSYGTVNLDLLNLFIGAAGSAYQFTALGGSSNWAGTPNGGALSLTGGITIPSGATGSTSLILHETEAGFTSPSGPSGLLLSASTATFAGAAVGNLHSAQSSFNGVTTPFYDISSSGVLPNQEGNSSLAAIPAFVTPYTLDNTLSFGLIPSPSFNPTDNFGAAAAVTTIPEPASVIMMSIGLPLALVGLARLGRRQARAKG
jgi:hypothetical protein